MTSRGGGRFRHVFRRVHQPFSFYARGGDDPRGDRLVTVETVEPPRVATIRAEIQFPEYTGRAPTEMVGGGIEAVIGSRVRLVVRATEVVRDAQIRFVDSSETLVLEPIEIQDDSGAGLAYAGSFAITRSDRYQVEFVGPTGIGNPRPGTYPIVAREDHAPIAKLVTPAADDLLVVLPDSLLPIRVFASDDFGVDRVEMRTLVGEDAHETVVPLYESSTDDRPTTGGPEDRETEDLVVFRILEVRALGAPDVPVSVGETVLLAGEVLDNRAPDAQATTITERHVHVVGPTDLTRRISGHFRRIRESVDKAIALQRSRQQQLTALLADGSSDSGRGSASRRDRLIAIEVGQGRVLTESRRVHRELMRSFDVHLFNRLEESLHASKVVELYREHFRSVQSADPVDPAFYRAVQTARREGGIGAMEKTLDPILGMLELADALALELGPAAVRAVEAASISASETDFEAGIETTRALQVRILESLESLRGELDEWNEFQDVIQQARSIRDRQKDLRNRTRGLQGSTK